MRDELELDELDPPPLPPPPLPPPPPDELLDDELREDEDEDDDDERDDEDDELDDGSELDDDDDELEDVLLPELEDDPLESPADVVLELPVPPSGPVGDVPHPTPNMPTPTRATPPDSILRNCRRSSRRVASSTGCGFSDWLMTTSFAAVYEQRPCQPAGESRGAVEHPG